MKRWKHSINIKQFLDDDKPAEEIGKQLADYLRMSLPDVYFDWEDAEYDEELNDIIEAFENITGYEDVSPVEEFDNILYDLYDWADDRRCWLGL